MLVVMKTTVINS